MGHPMKMPGHQVLVLTRNLRESYRTLENLGFSAVKWRFWSKGQFWASWSPKAHPVRTWRPGWLLRLHPGQRCLGLPASSLSVHWCPDSESLGLRFLLLPGSFLCINVCALGTATPAFLQVLELDVFFSASGPLQTLLSIPGLFFFTLWPPLT